jgi:hypothetical protein
VCRNARDERDVEKKYQLRKDCGKEALREASIDWCGLELD